MMYDSNYLWILTKISFSSSFFYFSRNQEEFYWRWSHRVIEMHTTVMLLRLLISQRMSCSHNNNVIKVAALGVCVSSWGWWQVPPPRIQAWGMQAGCSFTLGAAMCAVLFSTLGRHTWVFLLQTPMLLSFLSLPTAVTVKVWAVRRQIYKALTA